MSVKTTNKDLLLDLYDDVSAIKYTLQEMRHELSELRTIATQTSDIKQDLAYIKSLVRPSVPSAPSGQGTPSEAIIQESAGGGWTLW